MKNMKHQVNNSKIEKLSYHLLYIKKITYLDKQNINEHSHHFTEMFYVLQGQGTFIIDNESFEVQENDLVIINPNVQHIEAQRKDETFEYISLGMDGLVFTNQESINFAQKYTLLNYDNDRNELLTYLFAILEEIKRKDANYEFVCQNLLEVFVVNLIRRANKYLSAFAAKRTNKECNFIKEYIDQHYSEELSLESLAELTYINKFYLAHAFKKTIGISPINYMIQKRIDEAKELLETTNYSISRISDIVGFSSQSYFSQVFQKNMQMSPNQYRKSKRG